MDARYRQFDVLDDDGLTLYLISRYSSLGIAPLRTAWSNSDRPFPYFKTTNDVANAWETANEEMLDAAESWAGVRLHDSRCR